MKKSLWFTALPLCLSALVALWWLIDIPELFSGHFSAYYHIDLDVYREGGAGFGSDLYAKDYLVGSNRDVSLPFTYPPFAALLFTPLSWLPLTAASILVSVASFAALWACVALVLRSIKCSGWAAWALLAAMLTEPITETFSFGQVNILLSALVVVDILWLRPGRGRGVLTGIAMAIKLTPAVFLAVFFVRREWHAFFSSLGAFFAAGLIAFACNPHSWIQYWSETLRDSNRIGGLAYSSNQSLRGFFSRLGPREHRRAMAHSRSRRHCQRVVCHGAPLPWKPVRSHAAGCINITTLLAGVLVAPFHLAGTCWRPSCSPTPVEARRTNLAGSFGSRTLARSSHQWPRAELGLVAKHRGQ